MELPFVAKLDIEVPKAVIDSLTNLSLSYYNANTVNITKHKYLKFSRLYLQYLEGQVITEEANEDNDTARFLDFEKTKALCHWTNPNDKDIVVLRTFLDQHFNKYFQFTINYLEPHSSIGRHERHPWPRVFIPMHENTAEFTVWDERNREHKMKFDVGHCYFLNTWHDHAVTNQDSDKIRIMSSFCVDPRNNKLF